MSYILSFLHNTKLTLTQIGLGAIASLIGFLVVALELKGSALHKAQVQLLQARVQATDLQDGANIAKAREVFNNALNEYKGAKK
jgi:hypothetical protein